MAHHGDGAVDPGDGEFPVDSHGEHLYSLEVQRLEPGGDCTTPTEEAPSILTN